MNLELYKIFYVVADSKTITKAAQKLNISQPAITKHIKNLEEQLGGPLFIRSVKGMCLNENGKKLFPYIKQAMNLIETGERELNNQKNLFQGKIKIGISTTLTKIYLLPLLEYFHYHYPQITIEISTDPTSILKEKMQTGEIDFIICKYVYGDEINFSYQKLGDLHDIFVASKDYNIKNIHTLKDLKDHPILLQKSPSNSRKTMDTFLEQHQIHLTSVMDIASSNLLLEFVKIGYGIGYVTREYVKEELEHGTIVELSLKEELPQGEYGVLCLKNNDLSFASTTFMNLLLSQK